MTISTYVYTIYGGCGPEVNNASRHNINRQMRSFDIRSDYLIRNFSECCDNVKSLLFSSYCSSMHCAPLWSNFKVGTIRKLTVSYNNVLDVLCLYHGDVVPAACLFFIW